MDIIINFRWTDLRYNISIRYRPFRLIRYECNLIWVSIFANSFPDYNYLFHDDVAGRIPKEHPFRTKIKYVGLGLNSLPFKEEHLLEAYYVESINNEHKN